MIEREFTVPPSLMAEVSEIISENDIAHELRGQDEDGNILVCLYYERSERQAMYKVFAQIEDLLDEDEEPEEEEEDQN
jgi:hypothetical protein